MKKNKFFKLIFLSALIFVLSACTNPLLKNKTKQNKQNKNKSVNQAKNIISSTSSPQTVADELSGQSNIYKFDNLEDLQIFLEEHETSGGYGSMGRGMVMEEMAFDAVDSVAAPMAKMQTEAGLSNVADSGGGSDDFSKTNVQVEGVDEADIIKTDGKYIYAVVKNNLFIVDAYPAESAEIITKIEFDSRPQDIYINDNYLVIYGRDTQVSKLDVYSKFRRYNPYTFLKVFDVSDPKEPKQVRDLNFEGSYTNSRMIGDYVYFVTTNYNYYYIEDEPILPRIIEDGKVITNDCEDSVKCAIPDIYYFDIPYNSYNFTSINAINVKDSAKEINGDIYLMSSSQNMYVSLNNIFITYTKHISEYQLEMEVMREIVYPRLSARNQEKIRNIEMVENYILSQDEKMQKISRILERFASTLTDEDREKLEDELDEKMKQKYKDISKELEKTIIHKISINQDKLDYKTKGEVTGHVLNQFSMDEAGGYFRIATTKNRTWSRYAEEQRESYNNIYVLDDELSVVGSVENLAKGERIYSVRFMQNRAYMVTFKQVDPLFVIDLSVPTNPKVLGELKIPGFSNYLHPYDNETLIGVGKDTAESEWGGVRTKGLKLSLFDVSDVAEPKEIDVYVMGDAGSDSIALNDHKAFLFSRDKNLLVIPVNIREDLKDRGWGELTFSGAAVFKVNKEGFELTGKIDHSDGGRGSNSDYWRGYNYYDNTVKRSLYIDNVLYTFSNNYIKMNALEDLDLLRKLELKKDKSGDDFTIVN